MRVHAEARSLPAPRRPEVLACLPPTMTAPIIATSEDQRSRGAAWSHLHEPPLVVTPDGLAAARADHGRRGARSRSRCRLGTTRGLGSNAAAHLDAIALNVTFATRRPGSTRVPAFDSPAKAENDSAWR